MPPPGTPTPYPDTREAVQAHVALGPRSWLRQYTAPSAARGAPLSRGVRATCRKWRALHPPLRDSDWRLLQRTMKKLGTSCPRPGTEGVHLSGGSRHAHVTMWHAAGKLHEGFRQTKSAPLQKAQNLRSEAPPQRLALCPALLRDTRKRRSPRLGSAGLAGLAGLGFVRCALNAPRRLRDLDCALDRLSLCTRGSRYDLKAIIGKHDTQATTGILAVANVPIGLAVMILICHFLTYCH